MQFGTPNNIPVSGGDALQFFPQPYTPEEEDTTGVVSGGGDWAPMPIGTPSGGRRNTNAESTLHGRYITPNSSGNTSSDNFDDEPPLLEGMRKKKGGANLQ
eukprot:TRINITY_DN2310_c0_g1_i2.p3 TRINITY_DN2310_c0_g1~~TRINITY_DN2310_c0_g1_i2.p3  ORF type:complete len:113 (+),score=24.51 TRINITY_DN2310_c0_g1_i2:39-341(+)